MKTKQLLREKVWFPGIDLMAKQLTDSCLSRQATNNATHPEPLIMSELPPEPWHTLHIDFCGPFPGSYYLLVVVDAFTHFPEVDIITSTSAEITIPKLERIFATHGLPKFVKTDNGPPFPGVQVSKCLHILISLYDNLCEIPKDNGRTIAVFVEHAPDVWNMCLGCEVNSSQVVCPIGPPALRGPPCVL